MADKLTYTSPMMIHKITSSVNPNSLKSPKLSSQRIRKQYFKTLGTPSLFLVLKPVYFGTQSNINQLSNTTIVIPTRDGSDIGMFVTLVPNVLIKFSYSLA